jgi:O-antigen ligase
MTKVAFGALWLFAFTIPWQNAFVLEGFGTISRVIGVLAVAFAVLAVVATGRVRPLSVIQVLMLSFLCWAVLTTAWTIDPVSTGPRVTTYIQLFVMVCVIWQLALTPLLQHSLIRAFVLGSAVPAAGAIWGRLTGQAVVDAGRYAAANMAVNELGHIFALALAMACYLAATENKAVWFWFYTALMGVFQVGVLLTASRGAAICSAVAWLLLPWVFHRLRAYQKGAAVMIAAALVVAVLAVVPAGTWQRLAETSSEIESGSFSRRGHIWKAGWNVFQQNPIVGVGAGSFQTSVTSQLDIARTRSPHNSFLAVGVELGLVGLALFTGVLLCLFVGCLQLPGFDRRLGLILLTVWGMTSMVSNWEYHKVTWFVFGLIAAQVGGRVRLGMALRGAPAQLDPHGPGYDAAPWEERTA